MGKKFEIGERVRIKDLVKPHRGRLGIVKELDGKKVGVWLDIMQMARTPHVKWYKASEIKKVPKEEA